MPKPPKTFLEKDSLRGQVPDIGGNPATDGVYATYLEHIGVHDNEAMHIALASSPDPRFNKFLEMLKGGYKYKPQTIAKMCGIDLQEFQTWFQKAASQISIAHAQLKAAGIVADMAEDALSKDEACERCDGLGWVAAPEGLPIETPGYRILGTKIIKGDPKKEVEDREKIVFCRTCPKCRGRMTVREAGDEHARDRVLEIAGVIVKGKGATPSVTLNFGGASHQSAVQGALSSLTIDVDQEDVTDA